MAVHHWQATIGDNVFKHVRTILLSLVIALFASFTMAPAGASANHGTATQATPQAANKGSLKTEVTVKVTRGGKTTTVTDYVIGEVQPNHETGGTPSNSGCQTVTMEYRFYHHYIWPIPDYTIYVFVFDVYWCWWWPGRDVGNFDWYAHYIHVDPLWYPQGPHYHAHHYERDPGHPNSALRVDVAEQIQNCIGIQPAGCIATHNNWAWIGAHSDGTYSWDMGR